MVLVDGLVKIKGIIREMDEIDLRDPDTIYDTLKNIVEEYTAYCVHSAVMGMAREDGLEHICEQLNNLQEKMVFHRPYKIDIKYLDE